MGILVKNLEKAFGNPPLRVIKNLSFEIKDGDFVSLVGRSGSGKSTLLYLLSTLDEPSSGEIFLEGKEIRSYGSQELHLFRNQNIGFVFQFHYLLPELTAIENVLMPAYKLHIEKKLRNRAAELLKRFELGHRLDHPSTKLSGGEQQRVAIARALLMSPKYIFADEPTGNLDSQNAESVMRFFEEINRELKTTIVMVTHDSDFAKRASKSFHLVDGEILK